MNGQRDIDRTLEAWFLDGPSVMPDRLFDAVFDQVERVPQRRLAHLQLRFTEMNPRIRLFTVLAAALLVAVAAIAVIGGGSHGPVNASPTPTTSSITPVPAALQVNWMGGPRPLVGDDADAGSIASFTHNGFWMAQSNHTEARRFQSGLQGAGENRFVVETYVEAECEDGAVGTYTWSASASGKILTVTAESDPCADRLAAVPGTYWRMDCPTRDDNCLGPLDAGTYASQFLDPFVGPTDTWTPRFGALTYTVPERWVNVDDWPGFFGLEPEGAPDGTLIDLVTDAVAPSEDDPCSELASETIAQDAQSIAEWVADAPGVIASAPTAVVIGGRDAWRVDVSMDPAWTTRCPAFGDGGPGRIMFVDRDPGDGFSSSLVPRQRDRYYLIDVGAGQAFLVQIEGRTPEAFDSFVDDATTIVESFQLNP